MGGGSSTLLWAFLASILAVFVTGRAVAELMTGLFPDGVPGYDVDEGVTVTTRVHPDQMPLGVREGAFDFLPTLDESLGYNSNVLPGPYRRGSWQVVTAPSLAVNSQWSRNAFGALLSAQDTRDINVPSQDRLDGTVSAGGRIDIGDNKLTIAAAHIATHEDRGQLDSIPSDKPIAFSIDDVRASYAIADDRWSFVPNVDIANWTYGDTTILGLPTSQSYRDRIVAQTGVTVRYELEPLRSVVLVVRAIDQSYDHTPPGQINPGSAKYQILLGFDYDDDDLWHYRALVGGEVRHFISPKYADQNTLIAEAGVRWSPSGMTTVTALATRDTEDAAQEGVSGLVYTSAKLTIDHEYMRNLLLKASFGLQRADFFQGGHQFGTTAGLGAVWVLNRNARVSFTYDQTDLHGSSIPGQPAITGLSRGLALATLHLAL